MSKYFAKSSADWLVKEKNFESGKQGLYESLMTLGNGYLGVRGSLEENPHGSNRGVFIAGIFDQSEGYVPELVKAPGWVDLAIWLDERKVTVDTCKILKHERVLDLRKGILHRLTKFKTPEGKILQLETRRVVLSHQVRGALIDFSITPLNFSGEIKVYSGLNGEVTNTGYFPRERVKHLNLTMMSRSDDHIYLEMQARDNKTKIAMSANTVFKNAPLSANKVNRIFGEKVTQLITFKAEKKKSYDFTKWIATYTSREGYERQLEAATTDLLRDMVYEGVEACLGHHLEEREKQWEQIDIGIKGDQKAQLGIRFNLYHLLIAKPHHDPTVSVGAKFLTGEGYKGHVFWDTEIFMLPFYIYNFPEEAKNLLMYRYYTMEKALQNAHEMGYQGAKFAWESAETGLEMTPSYGLREDGSKVKIFTGEEEHHIVSDVVYGINNYFNATGDNDFLGKYGTEMVFQTARFWLSRVEQRRGRYEIRKVIGPDEFHEHVDNNAFTNYLVIWNLEFAVHLYDRLKKQDPEALKALVAKLKLKEDEIEKMQVVSKTLLFPYDQKTDLIEQFEGYFSLRDFKVEKHDQNGMPLLPKGVDEAKLDRTRLLKQADVVLLLYLFLDRFSPEVKKKNFKYYEARTMHKSSLSPCIYALMGLETGDNKTAYKYFLKTSYLDLIDANKNAADGIHAAATGGAWMSVVHGFAGMKVRRGKLTFNPWLPQKWEELSFNCFWQGSRLSVLITKGLITLTVKKGRGFWVKVGERDVDLTPGKAAKIKLK